MLWYGIEFSFNGLGLVLVIFIFDGWYDFDGFGVEWGWVLCDDFFGFGGWLEVGFE